LFSSCFFVLVDAFFLQLDVICFLFIHSHHFLMQQYVLLQARLKRLVTSVSPAVHVYANLLLQCHHSPHYNLLRASAPSVLYINPSYLILCPISKPTSKFRHAHAHQNIKLLLNSSTYQTLSLTFHPVIYNLPAKIVKLPSSIILPAHICAAT
jgi:hypothetical protein